MEYEVLYEEQQVNLKINAKRTLYGIGHIGYSPAKALLDIMDNSLENGAKNGYILIQRYDDTKVRSLNNIEEFLIIDDGNGMSQDEVMDALALGSSDENYKNKTDSLSKFGMGLKSAATSLGNMFDVISVKDGKLTKVTVDQNSISEDYVGNLVKPSTMDLELLNKYSIDHGTIIRVYDIYQDAHPSYSKIKSDLLDGQNAIGVVYYYLIKEQGKHIYLEGEEICAKDVLFEDEAVGGLDENDWDGAEIRYLQRETELEIPTESGENVKIKITATQMPHKKTRSLVRKEDKEDIENKYGVKVNSGNAGYYVYRNGRLISWADKLHENSRNYLFNGSNSMQLEGFRGRITITSDADKAFGIDVTKSKIQLSHEAAVIINTVAEPIQKKSAKAYQIASEKCSPKSKANELSNDTAQNINEEAPLPNEPLVLPQQTEEIRENIAALKKNSKDRLMSEIETVLVEDNPEKEYSESEIEEKTDEYIKKNISGKKDRIMLVNRLEEGMLFEPFYDDELGITVRINRNHRFAKVLYDNSNDNYKYIQMFMEFMFFECVEAEYRVLSRLDTDERHKEMIRQKFFDYRQNMSFQLEREAKEKGNIFDVNFEDIDI